MTKIATLLFLLSVMAASGQDDKEYRIQPGDNSLKVIPMEKQYLNAEFASSTVTMKGGRKLENQKMNYNMLTGAFAAINALGDTSQNVNNPLIESIQIGSQLFFHDPLRGYFEILGSSDSTLLVSRREFDVLRRERMGTDGYTSTSQTVSVGSTTSPAERFALLKVENLVTVLRQRTHYFLVDSHRDIHIADKSGFNNVFPNYSKAIRNYIASQKLRFTKGGSDQINLYNYLTAGKTTPK